MTLVALLLASLHSLASSRCWTAARSALLMARALDAEAGRGDEGEESGIVGTAARALFGCCRCGCAACAADTAARALSVLLTLTLLFVTSALCRASACSRR